MADGNARCDAVVVGAGFAGMYMVHLLRKQGLTVQGFERGDDVGGTWYWNRYPGCRCDVESMEYSYQFDAELEQAWQWRERYAAQPDILAYAAHVADRFDLRRAFRFGTAVTSAHWHEDTRTWRVATDQGAAVDTRYVVMATGCLSAANTPAFPGLTDFLGRTYHTGNWPPAGIDFSGQRVGVIGTGSSAIQSIPLIARQAAQLTVFQRTANYSIPAQNEPLDAADAERIKANYADLRARNRLQPAAFGADYPRHADAALAASAEDRERRFETFWQHGGFMFMAAFGDLGTNLEANELAAEFVRNKIRATVNDAPTAELLCPRTVIGCKRLCADTGYFATFNRPNVKLVDVSTMPIERITARGVVTNGQEYAFDSMVFATGFDAMTGALLRTDIRGEHNLTLNEKWSAGPRTYLGLMTAGFPNLFMMTGPGSPSVLANMITGVEQHAEFIAGCIGWADRRANARLSAAKPAEDTWVEIVNQRGAMSFFPRCNSWYLGANVPGKPRVFMPYLGFPDYSAKLRDVVANDYEGFVASG